jgi:hypothetical protein
VARHAVRRRADPELLRRRLFSFFIAWLFYRRLYGFGAAAIAVEIAISRLSPINSTLVDLMLCLAIGAFGKALVIRKGLRTIDAVTRAGLPHGEAAARIERLGGVHMSVALAGFSVASVIKLLASGEMADAPIPLDGLHRLMEAL